MEELKHDKDWSDFSVDRLHVDSAWENEKEDEELEEDLKEEYNDMLEDEFDRLVDEEMDMFDMDDCYPDEMIVSNYLHPPINSSVYDGDEDLVLNKVYKNYKR
jgi:hypothetical protein